MTMTVIEHQGGHQLATYAARVEYEIPSTLDEYRQIIRDLKLSDRTTYRYIKAIERAVSPGCKACGERECDHDDNGRREWRTTANGQRAGGCDGFAPDAEELGINLYDPDAVRRYGLDLKPGPRAHFVSAVRPIYGRARARVRASGVLSLEERQDLIMKLDAITGRYEGALADLRKTLKKNNRKGSGGSRSKLWLKPEQIDRLREKINMDKRRGRRDAVLLGLMVTCGLRRDEAVNVTWRSVVTRPANTGNGDADFHELVVTGKGDKTRSIPINSDLWPLLQAWREETAGGDDDPIVRRIGRCNAIEGGITPGAAQNVVMKYGAAIGVPQLRPHDLRRTYGRLCVQEKHMKMIRISQFLGHASDATTRIYLGLDNNPDDTRTDFIRW